MKKLLLGIFAFTFTATFAQDPVYVSVTGTCEASGGITWQEMMSGEYAYSGLFNGKDLYIRNFEYQGDQIPMSVRFDNTKWVLQADETSEVIFKNTTPSSGTFPPLSNWEPALDLAEEGCTAEMQMAVLLSTKELTMKQESSRIFPNPVSDHFELVNLPHNGTYTISDLSGKIVKSGRADQEIIFIGDLSAGNYLFKITGEDKSVSILKLIKK